ncbi:hypothetical protein ACFS07_34840 [Undibacterium arcticum]
MPPATALAGVLNFPKEDPMDNRQTVLVLHGGRALDANQAGIYEELSAQNTHIDWVVGTPIGAINGAIIAGNPPQHRVRKLHEFLRPGRTNGAVPLFHSQCLAPFFRRLENSGRTMETVINGIPGFPCSPQRRLPRIVTPPSPAADALSASRSLLHGPGQQDANAGRCFQSARSLITVTIPEKWKRAVLATREFLAAPTNPT